jgi:ethanolamine ammonia-lyase large subunit
MRRLFGLSPAPEFLAWLETRGIFAAGQLAVAEPAQHPLLAELKDVMADHAGQTAP